MTRGDPVVLELQTDVGVWRGHARVIAWGNAKAIVEVPDRVEPAQRAGPGGRAEPRRRYGVDFNPVRAGTPARLSGTGKTNAGRWWTAHAVKGYGCRLSLATIVEVDPPDKTPAPSTEIEGAGVAPLSRSDTDG